MLLNEDQMLLKAIVKYFREHRYLQKGTHILRSMFQIFQSKGIHCVLSMMTYILKEELDKTKTKLQIFRVNSVATVQLRFFMQQVMGNYLSDVVGPLVRKVLLSKEVNEIDPNQLKNKSVVKKNRKKLENECDKFINIILQTMQRKKEIKAHPVPSAFKMIAEIITNILSKRKDIDSASSISIALSSVFFLRYVCPVIISPSSIVDDSLKKKAMNNRQLTLIA